MGVPGNGYGSHVKFTIPDTFTSNDKLELVNIKFDNSTESSYGALYNLSSKIGIDYKPVSLNLKIVDNKFTFSDANDNIYNDSNKLYFEKDILYMINLDNSVTSSYKLGFKQNLVDFKPIVLTYTATTITLRFIKQETGLSIYNVLDILDDSGDNYLSISVYLPNSINYYINVDTSQFKLFKSLTYGNYTFNGQLEWEDGYNYLDSRRTFSGISGHSPLLGYAFDGHPIYGPLGYDKTTTNYLDDSKSASREVKFLKSSYTSSSLDTNGNPQYVPNSGDLDFCNGIFSKTPEFPQGIYHYVCTIKINEAGTLPLTVSDTDYGYRNIIRNRIIPQYPYIIGAFKGIPEVSNFPWATTTGAISDTSIEKKKFTFNFRSLKSNDVSVNGKTVKSISMTQDSNYINMLVNPQSYVWNFSNTQLTSFFGRDDYKFGNKISDLKSTSSDTTFKAYGSVSKWIAKGSISKGTAVRIVIQNVSNIDYLNIETYSFTVSISEDQLSAAILGIALNDASEGEECYVCTKGITTVIIKNAINIQAGSYGILTSGTENMGQVVGLTSGIIGDNPVVGYFLETKTENTRIGDYLLFQVSPTFEFN